MGIPEGSTHDSLPSHYTQVQRICAFEQYHNNRNWETAVKTQICFEPVRKERNTHIVPPYPLRVIARLGTLEKMCGVVPIQNERLLIIFFPCKIDGVRYRCRFQFGEPNNFLNRIAGPKAPLEKMALRSGGVERSYGSQFLSLQRS